MAELASAHAGRRRLRHVDAPGLRAVLGRSRSGWWSWIDSFVDVAVYPALFVEYLRFWCPEMTPVDRWLLAARLHRRADRAESARRAPDRARGRGAGDHRARAGRRADGGRALLGPRVSPWTPLAPPGQGWTTLGLGLAVVMWNYSGWDTPSTILGEARSPERAFRCGDVPGPAGARRPAYVLPVGRGPRERGSAAGASGRPASLPSIARRRWAESWLGHAVAAGAVLSTAGLFLSLRPHELAPAVRDGA